MSDSSVLIKKYFYSFKSGKLNSLINQVEIISEMSAKFIDADFIVLLYKNKSDKINIPLAYHDSNENKVSDLSLLEQKWCQADTNFEEYLNSNIQECQNDDFAVEFNYKYNYIHPFYDDDLSEASLVAYWCDKPINITNNQVVILNFILTLLVSTMDKTRDSRQFSDYSVRLSELIAMFEIAVGNYSFENLLNKLIEFTIKANPKYSYLLFIHDEKSKKYISKGKIPSPKPSDKFISSLEEQISSMELDYDTETPKGTLYDISSVYSEQYTVVLVSPICSDISKKIILAAYSKDVDALGTNNKEILSIFSLFANNIIRDALLLKKISNAHRLLKKSSAQLADIETLAALTDMTSGVAHDFNNNIGGIIGRVQLLKLKVKDDDILIGLNKIEKMALDGAQTVKRLQEFTSGVKSKKLDYIDLVETISDYFERPELKWEKTAKDKNIEINKIINISQAVIQGAESDLEVVVEKLVENAVEHADKNTQITIRITEDKNNYQLTVINFGQLIDESIKKKIFYPFFTTKSEYGAGLGLSIVQGIVIRHGGKIECSSDKKSGTSFKVFFPKPDKYDEDSDLSINQTVERDLKILIVDDDEQIREVLTDMLTIEGYKIFACEDGQTALKAIEDNKFDVMITDLGMPGMSGLDLAGIVHENNPKLPIAMITGWGTQLNEDEVALKGVKTVLPKPFHLNEIIDLIQKLVATV